ncbi:MAG TPA: hypothetical protein VEF76_04495 [Patescibacteria group bacterium]|nr:hypothetical protein [Patescibacteria group bacterium]
MVYDPSRPKGPATVPNSYILTAAKDDGFDDMVRAVDALIKSEGRESDVQWTSQLTFIGVGVIKCDDAFAAKLKTLPSVGSVEKENFVYPAKKKPGGPRL